MADDNITQDGKLDKKAAKKAEKARKKEEKKNRKLAKKEAKNQLDGDYQEEESTGSKIAVFVW